MFLLEIVASIIICNAVYHGIRGGKFRPAKCRCGKRFWQEARYNRHFNREHYVR